MSPTARTLSHLKATGHIAGVVERFNSFTKRRHDLFGFIDVVAINPTTKQTIGVQTTSGSNTSAREKKIRTECAAEAKAWIEAGNKIYIHGWRKLKGRWKCKEIEITF